MLRCCCRRCGCRQRLGRNVSLELDRLAKCRQFVCAHLFDSTREEGIYVCSRAGLCVCIRLNLSLSSVRACVRARRPVHRVIYIIHNSMTVLPVPVSANARARACSRFYKQTHFAARERITGGAGDDDDGSTSGCSSRYITCERATHGRGIRAWPAAPID